MVYNEARIRCSLQESEHTSVSFHRLPPENAPLTVHLFGGFEAFVNGIRVRGLHERHAEKLLAYLILRRGQSVAKETIVNLFWSGTADLARLRQSLLVLRQGLGYENGRLAAERRIVRLDLD